MAEAKFDIRSEATRPFYATVGTADLAVEVARQYVADLQARVADVQNKVSAFEFEPKTLNDKATSLVNARREDAESRVKDAQSRLQARLEELQAELKDAQAKFEARVAELQSDAKAFPGKAQAFVKEYADEVTRTYTDLVARGEQAVAKIRKAEVKVDVEPKATKTTVTAEAKTSATEKAAATKPTATKPATKKAPAKKAAPKKA